MQLLQKARASLLLSCVISLHVGIVHVVGWIQTSEVSVIDAATITWDTREIPPINMPVVLGSLARYLQDGSFADLLLLSLTLALGLRRSYRFLRPSETG